jgi:undecaprenyl-diphosphatase
MRGPDGLDRDARGRPPEVPARAPTDAPPGAARERTLLRPLIAVLASSALLAAFAALASLVVAGDTHAFDEALLHGARALRAAHPWFAYAMRDVSALGSTAVLTLVVVLATGYLVLAGRPRLGALVALSAIGGATGVSVLKSAIGRLRPDSRLAESVVEGLSFPSGHATMSAAIYLTLGALLASTRARRRERAWLLGAAAAIAALVGASRVVLGVHWATDVLGGWAFGAAWAIVWLLLARAAGR